MQSNIVNMFPTDRPEIPLRPYYAARAGFSAFSGGPAASVYRPSRPEGQARERRFLEILLHNMQEELQTLDGESLPFLRKFEQVLRIIYRYHRFNPLLVLFFQDTVLHDRSLGAGAVRAAEEETHRAMESLLMRQARKEDIFPEEGGMGQLILFLLMEVVKTYQNALTDCCREMVERDGESPFPGEDEMVRRFHRPIASRLEGLICS